MVKSLYMPNQLLRTNVLYHLYYNEFTNHLNTYHLKLMLKFTLGIKTNVPSDIID